MIQVRKKFFVNNIGRSAAFKRGSAFLKIAKPQYFRSLDAESGKRDSMTGV